MKRTARKSVMITMAVATLSLCSPAFAEGRGNSERGSSESSSGGGNSSSESTRERSSLSGAQNAALRARQVAAADSAVVSAAILECELDEGGLPTGSTYNLGSRECELDSSTEE